MLISAYTPGDMKYWTQTKSMYQGREYINDIWLLFNFEFGNYKLKEAHYYFLGDLSRELIRRCRLWKGEYYVVLSGHASPSGENTPNRNLAKRRALESQKILELYGIAKTVFRLDLSEIWSVDREPDDPERRDLCRSVSVKLVRIRPKPKPPSPVPPFKDILDRILEILRKYTPSERHKQGQKRLLNILPMLNRKDTDDRFINPYIYNKLVWEPREPFDEYELPHLKQAIDLPFFWRHYRSNPNMLAKQLIETEGRILYAPYGCIRRLRGVSGVNLDPEVKKAYNWISLQQKKIKSIYFHYQ